MRTVISPTPLHFHDLAGHFLSLSPNDRFLRFGSVMSDAWIVAYVESLLASDDTVFVAVESGRDISGALHLESTGSGVVLGLSVSSWARRLGIGSLLMRRAGLLARTQGVKTLFVRNLNFNVALRQLALRLGMGVACAPTASSTSLEVPAVRGRDAWQVEFTRTISLADDSLRSHCKGAPLEASLHDLPEAIAS